MDLPFSVTLEIGKVLGIRKSPISRARGIRSKGSPTLIAQVYRGEISLWEATCQLYPATAAAHVRSKARDREANRTARNAPVELPPQLPATSTVSREVRTSIVHACDIILGLPRPQDVVAVLSPSERDKLAKAYLCMEELYVHL